MNDTPSSRLPKQIKAYEVVKQVGRGGMGEVFLARHDALDRQVAIKRYSLVPGVKDDKKNLERFHREGKALARLSHHGIVAIHDLFEHRGQMHMVLEYVDGLHVGELCTRGPLPEDVACIIGLKVAEALAHAHHHKIVHRDIKATNVMVARSGAVKLMDFGIARGEVLDKVTQTGLVVGTPLYLAPEVIAGGEPTPQSDVYGLGALMYHCLTGQKLFHHAAQEALFHQIVAGNYVAIHKLVKGLPRQLRQLVDRCLERRPEKRFGSAAGLRQALDLYLADRGYWGNHEERLAVFLKWFDRPSEEGTPTSVEVSMSDFVVQSSKPYRPPRRALRIAVVALGSALLGAGAVVAALKLGWLEPVLLAMGMGGP